ncbi:MAG: hypothetical protein DLM69_03220 [Candidatus Chloroheliales bacterium]|nr:MAG: hypothetical protein DLM69_03220 [Chloroflexota bacterium]
MLNWYEQQIRSEEIERELANRRQIHEARAARPYRRGWLGSTRSRLGRGLVAWGWRLQQHAADAED